MEIEFTNLKTDYIEIANLIFLEGKNSTPKIQKLLNNSFKNFTKTYGVSFLSVDEKKLNINKDSLLETLRIHIIDFTRLANYWKIKNPEKYNNQMISVINYIDEFDSKCSIYNLEYNKMFIFQTQA